METGVERKDLTCTLYEYNCDEGPGDLFGGAAYAPGHQHVARGAPAVNPPTGLQARGHRGFVDSSELPLF